MEKTENLIKSEDLDLSFKYIVKNEPGGEGIMKCYACGTCTASCPVRAIDETFNPRRIIRMVLLGMKKEVLSSDFVWICSTCYICQERCPQDVSITELMGALKNIAVKEGYIHPGFKAQIQAIYSLGALYEIGEFENKKREKMGLPKLTSQRKEIEKIFEITGLSKIAKEEE